MGTNKNETNGPVLPVPAASKVALLRVGTQLHEELAATEVTYDLGSALTAVSRSANGRHP